MGAIFSWPILAMVVKVVRVYEIELELESTLEPCNIYNEVRGVVRLDMFVGLTS